MTGTVSYVRVVGEEVENVEFMGNSLSSRSDGGGLLPFELLTNLKLF